MHFDSTIDQIAEMHTAQIMQMHLQPAWTKTISSIDWWPEASTVQRPVQQLYFRDDIINRQMREQWL